MCKTNQNGVYFGSCFMIMETLFNKKYFRGVKQLFEMSYHKIYCIVIPNVTKNPLVEYRLVTLPIYCIQILHFVSPAVAHLAWRPWRLTRVSVRKWTSVRVTPVRTGGSASTGGEATSVTVLPAGRARTAKTSNLMVSTRFNVIQIK